MSSIYKNDSKSLNNKFMSLYFITQLFYFYSIQNLDSHLFIVNASFF